MLNNECKNVHHLLDLALGIMEINKDTAEDNEAVALFGGATQMSIHTTKPNEFMLLRKTNLAFAFNNDDEYQRGKRLVHIPLAALKKFTGDNWVSISDNDQFEIWLKPESEPQWI